MKKGKYVFAQIMSLIHSEEFARCVERYHGNYRVRTFSCWHQFLCLSFGQLSHRESLRDIVLCLNSHHSKLYHLGITHGVKRSTLADANKNRDWRIFEDLAKLLITKARKIYIPESETAIELKNVIYALDSTTIDLCLDVFWWAKFRKRKGAIKLHTLLDVKCEIPTFVHITDGSVHDVNVLDVIDFEKDAFYIMDRGYIDWARLFKMNHSGAFFTIRAKSNFAFIRLYSNSIDKSTGLRCDQTIKLKNYYAVKDYPEYLRRIKFYDKETKKTYVYLTNNFEVPSMQIVILYINRWKVEIFFKWIKQHLKIKKFWGETANAVKTQIWVAICTFVQVAILKEKLKSLHSMNEILQILSISLFEQVPVNQLLMKHPPNKSNDDNHNQLILWDL